MDGFVFVEMLGLAELWLYFPSAGVLVVDWSPLFTIYGLPDGLHHQDVQSKPLTKCAFCGLSS